MAKTKKVIQEVEVETFEYVNTTNTDGMRPEVMFFTLHDGSTKKVLPGKSIFFTQEDIDNHLADEDRRFIEGRIRPRNAKEDQLDKIQVNDFMSEMEAEMFVRDTESTRSFGQKLANVNSLSTLSLIKKFVENYDKPYSFMKSCDKRMDKIRSEREEAMRPSPMPKDKSAEAFSK